MKHADPFGRLDNRKPLIIVDHEFNVVTGSPPQGANRFEIGREVAASNLEFDRGEALRDRLFGFGRGSFRSHRPETGVCLHSGVA